MFLMTSHLTMPYNTFLIIVSVFHSATVALHLLFVLILYRSGTVFLHLRSDSSFRLLSTQSLIGIFSSYNLAVFLVAQNTTVGNSDFFHSLLVFSYFHWSYHIDKKYCFLLRIFKCET